MFVSVTHQTLTDAGSVVKYLNNWENVCFHTMPSSPLGNLGVFWESEHVRRRFGWGILSRDEAWELRGAAGIISSLISGKVWLGNMILRCSSNSSLSFLSAIVISVSTCCARSSKDKTIYYELSGTEKYWKGGFILTVPHWGMHSWAWCLLQTLQCLGSTDSA